MSEKITGASGNPDLSWQLCLLSDQQTGGMSEKARGEAMHAVQCAVDALRKQNRRKLAALEVIRRDPKIRAWLEANDPQALQQVEEACKP